MATRGIVIWVGGQRPWIARFGDGTSPSNGDPFETLRAAQAPIDAGANKPLRWTRLNDAEGLPVAPETWVADDLATPAVTVGGTGPFALAAADQFTVVVDGTTNTTATFTAQPAVAVSQVAGSYTLVAGGMLVTVKTPTGTTALTVNLATPPFGAQPAAAAAAWMNANATFSTPGLIVFNSSGSNITVETVGQGTGYTVGVAGGSIALAVALGFTATVTTASGGGNVPNIAAVTAAQARTVLAAQLSGVVSTVNQATGALTIARSVSGAAYSIQVSPTSGVLLGFDTTVHYGTN